MFRGIYWIILFVVANGYAQVSQSPDPIQRCLDVRRLVDLSSRQKMAAKEPGVFRFKFHKVSAKNLPWAPAQGNMQEIITALQYQVQNCKKPRASTQSVRIAGRLVTRQQWCLQTSERMLTIAMASHGSFARFLTQIKGEFDWYQSEGWPENHAGFKKGQVQFTAYYAPEAIEARRKRGSGFLYPFYRNPGVIHVALESRLLGLKPPLCGVDPVSHIPRNFCLKNANGTYSVAPSRREIDQGFLDARYVIGYVKDANDPAFVMLQGSGSLRIDGQVYRINYEAANGRPRTMLGRIVQCAQDPTCGGNLERMAQCAHDPNCHDEEKLRCQLSKKVRQSGGSEQQIRQYLDRLGSKQEAMALRHRDESYVFFSQDKSGPYGSENIVLTPHVSCATDHKVIPVGMSFLYHTQGKTAWCIAQDAGGAIIGAHVDIYKGEGHQAGKEANSVNHSGSLFVALVKKGH